MLSADTASSSAVQPALSLDAAPQICRSMSVSAVHIFSPHPAIHSIAQFYLLCQQQNTDNLCKISVDKLVILCYYYLMSNHILELTAAELKEWQRTAEVTFASASGYGKRKSLKTNGVGDFIVRNGDKITYLGGNAKTAIRRYNKIDV